MLQNFYEKDQKEVSQLVKRFLLEDFFPHFPKWKDKISIVIEGSVASGYYDRFSDIDLGIILPKRLSATYSLEHIKAYKKHLREIGEPVQLHVPKTIQQLTERLGTWEKDGDLRELANAITLFDPTLAVKDLKKRFKWYPKEIFHEKIHWLIAESVFRFEERFTVAQKRSELFFGEVNKIEIIRLLLTACLLANKQYPSFDKHLYAEIKILASALPRKIMSLIDELLQTHDLETVGSLLEQLLNEVKGYCVTEKLIKNESREYWIGLRPKYKVCFE